MTDAPERPKLRDVGPIYVTYSAAQQYARDAQRVYSDGERLEPEEARRDLTELLLESHRVEGDTETPERWRFKRGSLGIQIDARVVRERSRFSAVDLLVVVQAHSRFMTSRSWARERNRH